MAWSRITYGFLILTNSDQVLVDEQAEPVDLPDRCDDYLAVAEQ